MSSKIIPLFPDKSRRIMARPPQRIAISDELSAQFLAMGAQGATKNDRLQSVAANVLACGDLACFFFVKALASREPVGAVMASFGHLTPEAYRAALCVLKKGGTA